MAKAKRAAPLTLGGETIAPGSRRTLELPLASIYSHVDLNMPVQVVHGKRPGPALCVSAGVHGDEIGGVEVVRQLLQQRALSRLRGTLVAVPVVNMFGFLQQSRYLPDRRDLNRAFPGSEKGSLAGRLANLFLTEVVGCCSYAIDLHTASVHRTNLPQIRACLDDPRVLELAEAFGAPVILDGRLREGSLRKTLYDRGVPSLLYEAGEALRFDSVAVRAGIRGILSVMRSLGMLPASRRRRPASTRALDSTWSRAPTSGIFHPRVRPGTRVAKGDRLGYITSPFDDEATELYASASGIIIGMTQIPLVNEGDAICHVARFDRPSEAEKAVEAFHERHADLEDPD